MSNEDSHAELRGIPVCAEPVVTVFEAHDSVNKIAMPANEPNNGGTTTTLKSECFSSHISEKKMQMRPFTHVCWCIAVVLPRNVMSRVPGTNSHQVPVVYQVMYAV